MKRMFAFSVALSKGKNKPFFYFFHFVLFLPSQKPVHLTAKCMQESYKLCISALKILNASDVSTIYKEIFTQIML